MLTIFIVVDFLEEGSSRRRVYPCSPRLVGIKDMPVHHIALPVEKVFVVSVRKTTVQSDLEIDTTRDSG